MSPPDEELDEDFAGRCYTKARRAPLVHGVVRSVNGGPGFRLPFGPYTLTQLAAIVLSVGLLILSRPLWGGHGLGDVLVLALVPFGAAFAMRHLHVDGRNPAAAAASVVLMLAGPRWGRVHGRPLRPARTERDAPRVTLAHPDLDDAPAPTPARAAHPRRPPAQTAPLPAAAPMASGVQALLARAAPAPTDLEN
ncbi:conjugal transfer protein [Streptomyces olivaceus]|uniref:conjugal transfer protein n=1 Tax=Streptomyces olivaceus TaxID=47716 RepID=UPI001CCB2B74|nr:conjugal transfer protein [Streptomyces olivaceus]MBZ6295909.1 conjugal transfer protein [Streptomyces olivaceus]MBZ6330887.1 conjugal transfer protein [Streptomyces olivaceus]